MTRTTHKPHRSEMCSIKDVLDILVQNRIEGVKVSTLCTVVNMGHYLLLDKCQVMLDGMLIEEKRDGKNRSYTITDKGILALKRLEKLENLLKGVGLRL